MTPRLSFDRIHASCVAIDGRALLIGGRSGAGKSDLALRLIDRGADLVSDDYTLVRRIGTRLIASAPKTIAGRIEVRGIGIVEWPCIAEAPVALYLDLTGDVVRMPDAPPTRLLAGIAIPMLALDPMPPSAPIKAAIALRRHGLPA